MDYLKINMYDINILDKIQNMPKILKLITIISLSALISAGIFSLFIAHKLYFPKIKEMASDTKAGLSLSAYQYQPWLWNRERITIINILDRKNDAPNIQYKIKGEVYGVRLIHSGEDFALIAFSDPNFSSLESGYIVHRSPKSESKNTIEEIHIGGNIIAVAPDESGYFYISQDKIFKKSWAGETVMSADLGTNLEAILNIQLTSMSCQTSNQPVLFFNKNTKMAFWGTPWGVRYTDGYLFIWDLENNETKKIPRQDFGDYNDLKVEDDKLYIEKINESVSQKLIVE